MAPQGWIAYVLVSDDGLSWSQPIPLFLPFPHDAGRAATGNGSHGVQLPSGRLLVQAGFTQVRDDRRADWNVIVRSDDPRSTWCLGEPSGGASSLTRSRASSLGTLYVTASRDAAVPTPSCPLGGLPEAGGQNENGFF